ncbi:MAG: stage II sporulation protein M [Bacillota bacterium]
MRKVGRMSPFVICVSLFTVGLLLGVFGLRVLSPDEKAELVSYLEVFMRGLQNPGLPANAILKLSIVQNAKTAVLLWAFGLAVIGTPLTCLLLLVRGFAIGFGSAFVIREVTTGGVAVFMCGMLPHNLFAVPVIVALSALSLSFSLALVRDRPWTFGGLWRMAAAYTWRFALLSLGLIVSSLIEAYVSPALLLRTAGM